MMIELEAEASHNRNDPTVKRSVNILHIHWVDNNAPKMSTYISLGKIGFFCRESYEEVLKKINQQL